MIAARTKDGYILYVTFCRDGNGYYCQVYTDDTLDNEVDNFCIHDDELQYNSERDIAEQHVKQLTLKPC